MQNKFDIRVRHITVPEAIAEIDAAGVEISKDFWIAVPNPYEPPDRARLEPGEQLTRRGQQLTIHSWIYGLQDGLLRDLGLTVSNPEELAAKLPGSLAHYEDTTA